MRIPLTRAVLISLAVVAPIIAADGPPRPPPTRVEVVTDRMHGIDIPDPYRWLEDHEPAWAPRCFQIRCGSSRTVLANYPPAKRRAAPCSDRACLSGILSIVRSGIGPQAAGR
jgi:hypothetical protein